MQTFVRCVALLGAAIIILQPACRQNDAPAGDNARDREYIAVNNIPFLSAPLEVDTNPAAAPGNVPVAYAPGAVEKNKTKEKEVFVIGEKLKVGMPLDAALSLLGTPKSIKINRGTEPEADSISIEYLNHGLKIHALTKKTRVEELEVLPTFRGEFYSGLKIGTKIHDIVKTFGTPASKDASIINYPEIRMFLILKNEDTLVSARFFARNSKLLDYKLLTMGMPEPEPAPPSVQGKREPPKRRVASVRDFPPPPSTTPMDSGDLEDIVMARFLVWIQAWQNKDVEAYFTFYSKNFKDSSQSFNRWEKSRRRALRKTKKIHIEVSDVSMKNRENSVEMSFLQNYQSDIISDIGRKVLVWKNEAGQWKIIRETWEPV